MHLPIFNESKFFTEERGVSFLFVMGNYQPDITPNYFKMRNISILTAVTFMMISMANSLKAQVADSSKITKYTRVRSGFLMVLRRGDDLIRELESFAVGENIPSANFTGMGFVNVTFGFFDAKTGQYKPQDFKDVELASMHGTIAWKANKPSIHCHGVVGDKNFESFAGHILDATVGTGSLEILITVHDKKLERRKDETIGADVLQIE
jgi:predicted DNA-binding protein with PD1-like motif